MTAPAMRTGDVAHGFADPRISVHAQANGGLPAARNAGIRHARGDVVCFLDADDLLLPHYLRTVREMFAAHPDAAFVYGDAWTFSDRTRRVRKRTTTYFVRPPRPAPTTADGMFAELIRRNFIIIPVAVRRTVIVAEGMFDEAMTSAEDWDMWLRLSAGGTSGRRGSRTARAASRAPLADVGQPGADGRQPRLHVREAAGRHAADARARGAGPRTAHQRAPRPPGHPGRRPCARADARHAAATGGRQAPCRARARGGTESRRPWSRRRSATCPRCSVAIEVDRGCGGPRLPSQRVQVARRVGLVGVVR